jgi:hypothetical protein
MSDNPKLNITEFKLNMIGKNAAIVIIAKRGSGKSFLCRELINHFRNYPAGIIISESERFDDFYLEFFPGAFIYDHYIPEILDKLFNRQIKIKEKNKLLKKMGKRIDRRIFIIMDDCLSSSDNWKRDEHIKQLLFNGRHMGITYILTMQFPLGVTPELRNNFDYVFLLADDIQSNQERIWKHYAGVFPTINAFRDVYRDLTFDFGSMVLVNKGAKEGFHEKVFWYKSKKIIPELIGSDQFREYNKNNFNPNYRDKKKKVDIGDYCATKKRNKEKIKVDKVSETKK